MQLINLKTEQEYLEQAAEFIFNNIDSSKENHIALSGGSLKILYKYIARKAEGRFLNTVFWMVDERYVPKDHPESNYKLIKDNLLDILGEGNYREFYYFDIEKNSKEEPMPPTDKVLDQYEFNLKQNLERFDICMLGIGPDGHTGSIFPHSNAISENLRLVAHTQTEEFAVKDRFTLTFEPIMQSKKLMVGMMGSSKQVILDKIMKNANVNEVPASHLLKHDDLTIFFGDY